MGRGTGPGWSADTHGGGADASQAEPGTHEAAGGRGGLRGAGAGTDELPGCGRRGGGALPLFRRHRHHGGRQGGALGAGGAGHLDGGGLDLRGGCYPAQRGAGTGTPHEQPFTCRSVALSGEAAAGPVGGRGAAAQCRPHHHSLQRGGCRGGERLPPLPPGAGLSDHCIHPPPLYDGRPAAGGLRPPCQRSGRPGGSVLPPTGAGRDAPHGTEDLDAPPGGYDHLGGGGRLSHIRQLRQHRVVGLALRHLLYRRIGRALSLPRHHRRL